MKNKKVIVGYLVVSTMIATACSSVKNSVTPSSLYKTEEGEMIAYESYENALSLFKTEYTEDYVNTDYGQTHILISGVEDGKPLLILPGLFGDASMWYPNVGELSEHFKVFTLDMPNYGGKSKPGHKAVEEFNDYLVWFQQILDHYELSKVSLVGISYSSWLILALSREIPDRISTMVLLDPSETFMPMNGGIAWKGFKYFMFFPDRNKYSKSLDWLGGGYTNNEMLIWREHMLDVIEFGSTKMFDVPQHRIFTQEELTMVSMPVLIMAGGKPILYDDPRDFKTNALNSVPQAEVVIVPGAGHGLNMEKPDFVNTRIIDFIQKN